MERNEEKVLTGYIAAGVPTVSVRGRGLHSGNPWVLRHVAVHGSGGVIRTGEAVRKYVEQAIEAKTPISVYVALTAQHDKRIEVVPESFAGHLLAFGLHGRAPGAAPAVWGARAIWNGREGYLDIPHDRRDVSGERDKVRELVDKLLIEWPAMMAAIERAVDDGRLSDRSDKDVILVQSSGPGSVKVVCNANASYGYLYLVGWLEPGLGEEEGEEGPIRCVCHKCGTVFHGEGWTWVSGLGRSCSACGGSCYEEVLYGIWKRRADNGSVCALAEQLQPESPVRAYSDGSAVALYDGEWATLADRRAGA